MSWSLFTDLWLPFLVAAVLAAAATLRSHLGRSCSPACARVQSGALALAIGGAIIALHLKLMGRPGWPMPGLTERLLPAMAAATLLSVIGAALQSLWSIAAFSVLSAAAAAGICLWPSVASPETRLGAIGLIIAAALLAAISSVCLHAMSRRGHAVAAATIIACLGLACGAALLGSGSIVLGQFGLAVGAAATGVLLAIVPGPVAMRLGGVASAAMSILAALLVAGTSYSEQPRLPAVVFGLAAPAAFLVTQMRPLRTRSQLAGILAILAAALFAGLAAGFSVDLTGRAGAADSYGYE
jgi:hypothetical protein